MDDSATIHFVGAGPGDPGLLTVRGRDLLAAAGFVAMDAELGDGFLPHLASVAEVRRVSAAERADVEARHRLNDDMAERAGWGTPVVRLQLGDPFLMGRASEDVLYLKSRGARVVVVPGVSAALASPTQAGIPLVQPGVFNSVFLTAGPYVGNAPLTGGGVREASEAMARAAAEPPAAEAPAEPEAEHRGGVRIRRRHKDPIGTPQRPHRRELGPGDVAWWQSIARCADTLLLLNPLADLDVIQSGLMAGGRAASEPAALVVGATTAAEHVYTATIGTLEPALAGVAAPAPVVLVVGDVVNLRDHLLLSEPPRLAGRRLALLGAADAPEGMATRLKAAGAQVRHFPAIEAVADPRATAILHDLESLMATARGVLFTTAEGPTILVACLAAAGLDRRAFVHGCRFMTTVDATPSTPGGGIVVGPVDRNLMAMRHGGPLLVVGSARSLAEARERWTTPPADRHDVELLAEEVAEANMARLKGALFSDEVDAIVVDDALQVAAMEEAWGEQDFAWLLGATAVAAVGPAVGALRHHRVPRLIAVESGRAEELIDRLALRLGEGTPS